MAKAVEVITINDSDDDAPPVASGSRGGAPKARAAQGSGARRKRKADKKRKGKQLETVDLTVDSDVSEHNSDIEMMSCGPALVSARSPAKDSPAAQSEPGDVEMRLEDPDVLMESEDAKPLLHASTAAVPGSPIAPIPSLKDQDIQEQPPSHSASAVDSVPWFRPVIDQFLAAREAILAQQTVDGLPFLQERSDLAVREAFADLASPKTRADRLDMYDSYVSFCASLRITSFPLVAPVVALFLHHNDLANPEEDIIRALVAADDARRLAQRNGELPSGIGSSQRAFRGRTTAPVALKVSSAGKQRYRGYVPPVDRDDRGASSELSSCSSAFSSEADFSENESERGETSEVESEARRLHRPADIDGAEEVLRTSKDADVVAGLVDLNRRRSAIFAAQRNRAVASLQAASDDAISCHLRSYYKPTTLTSYSHAVRTYHQFCAQQTIRPFPIVAEVIALFLHDYAYGQSYARNIFAYFEQARLSLLPLWAGTPGVAAAAEALTRHPAATLITRSHPRPSAVANADRRKAHPSGQRKRGHPPKSPTVSTHSAQPVLSREATRAPPRHRDLSEEPDEAPIVFSDLIPGMPQPGANFISSSAFTAACRTAARNFMGISMFQASESSKYVRVRCNRNLKPSTGSEMCPFQVVALAGQNGRWFVDGNSSTWSHNHGRHPKIIADPDWRPKSHTARRSELQPSAQDPNAVKESPGAASKLERSKRPAAGSDGDVDGDGEVDREHRHRDCGRFAKRLAVPLAPSRSSSSASTLDVGRGGGAYATPTTTPVPLVDGKPSIAPPLALDRPLTPADLSSLLADLSPLLSSPSIAAVLHRSGINSLARLANLVFAPDQWLEEALPPASHEFKTVPRLILKKKLAEKRTELSRA